MVPRDPEVCVAVRQPSASRPSTSTHVTAAFVPWSQAGGPRAGDGPARRLARRARRCYCHCMGLGWIRWVIAVGTLVACGPSVGPSGNGGGADASSDGDDDGTDDGDDATSSASSPATAGDATGVDACTGSCDCEPSGTLLWQRTYRAPELQRVVGRALARLPDGRLVVGGAHVALSPDDLIYGDESLWVATFDAEANHEASAIAFQTPRNSGVNGGFGMAADGSHIAVAGTVLRGDGWSDGVLAVFDLDLQPRWSVRDQPAVGSSWSGAALDQDGSVVVTGWASLPTEDSVAVVHRFTAEGDPVWTQQIAGTDPEPYWAKNRARSVAVGGGLAWVTGTLFNDHEYGEEDVWLSSWQADGTMVTQVLYDSRTELTTYASLGWDHGHAVAIAPDGAVLVAGSHYVEKPKEVGSYAAGERWARLVELDGTERWSWWHDEPGVFPGIAYAVTFDACGNAFVVGEQAAGFDADDQMFVAKLSPDGALLWEVDDQPTTSEYGTYSVIADDDGSVVVLTNEGEDTVVFSRFSP